MGGDVWQWNDADVFGNGSTRQLRGGSWQDDVFSAGSGHLSNNVPSDGYSYIGFRVTLVGGVPEPVTIVMAVIGFVGLLIFSQRRRPVLRLHPGRDAGH
jgi:hypothetical protein